MLRTYLFASFRALKRHRLTSLLNLLGLSTGMAAFLLLVSYAKGQLDYDQFHEKGDHLYRVTLELYKQGELDFHSATNFPKVAKALEADFPEVEASCRIFRKYRAGSVRYEDRTFKQEHLVYADPSFFELFSFKLIRGNPTTALEAVHTGMINASLVERYFGSEDPIGKRIQVGSMDGLEEFEITGVFEVPGDTHMPLDFVFSYASLIDLWGTNADTSWGWNDFFTYVLLNENADVESMTARFPAFADQYGGDRLGSKRVGFSLQSVKDIHLDSDLMLEMTTNGDRTTVNFLMLLAVLILAIAWINFMGLSTAKATLRAREVGVRKALGASRFQLIRKFLAESWLMNGLAIFAAVGLFSLALPWLVRLTGHSLGIEVIFEPWFLGLLGLLWLVGGLASGFYPAWVLSAFHTLRALKGQTSKTHSGMSLRKVLILVQFLASSSLITGTLIIKGQLNFMQEQDKGIEVEDVLVVKAPDVIPDFGDYAQSLQVFRNSLEQLGGVQVAAISSEIPGKQVSWYGAARRTGNETSFPVTTLYKQTVDAQYLSLFEHPFLAGRNFLSLADSNRIILNEKGIKALGFNSPEEAINQPVELNGQGRKTIVGVIANFHHEALMEDHKPTVYLLMEEERLFFLARLDGPANESLMADVRSEFRATFPNHPFETFMLADYYKRGYTTEGNFLSLFSAFAILAIFIALLGLIGLVFFTTTERLKEIGIRKVLGARAFQLYLLIGKESLQWVLLANLISIPLVVLWAQGWLEGFAFRQSLSWPVFSYSMLLSLFFALSAMSYLLLKAIRANPVEVLNED